MLHLAFNEESAAQNARSAFFFRQEGSTDAGLCQNHPKLLWLKGKSEKGPSCSSVTGNDVSAIRDAMLGSVSRSSSGAAAHLDLS